MTGVARLPSSSSPPFPLFPAGYLSHQEPPSSTGREETYHTYLHMEARRRAPSSARME